MTCTTPFVARTSGIATPAPLIAIGSSVTSTVSPWTVLILPSVRSVEKSTDEQREAAKLLEDLYRTLRRVMGDAHPLTMQVANILPVARLIGVKVELK